MNLAIRGIESKKIQNDDCLVGHPYATLKANRIMANPTFNHREWGYEKLKEDKRFKKFGLPSYSKPGGNYAFMEHMIYHMDEEDGRMGLVLANGSLSASGQEAKIREAIVRADYVDCIVALPTKLFYTVQIPACLWFLTVPANKKNGPRNREGETLFIDARNISTPVERSLNEFSLDQIDYISDRYRSFIGQEDVPKYKDELGFCKKVTIKDIEKEKFILNPGRYVGSEDVEDDDEPFEDKMKRLTSEYAVLSKESVRLDKEIRKNLQEIGFEI